MVKSKEIQPGKNAKEEFRFRNFVGQFARMLGIFFKAVAEHVESDQYFFKIGLPIVEISLAVSLMGNLFGEIFKSCQPFVRSHQFILNSFDLSAPITPPNLDFHQWQTNDPLVGNWYVGTLRSK